MVKRGSILNREKREDKKELITLEEQSEKIKEISMKMKVRTV